MADLIQHLLALFLIIGIALLLIAKFGQVSEAIERRLKIIGYILIIIVLTSFPFLILLMALMA